MQPLPYTRHDFETPAGGWRCRACGACCMRVDMQYPAPGFFDLRTLDRGDGRCINLGDDFKCKIYEDRPDSCRMDVAIEAMGETWAKDYCVLLASAHRAELN